MCVFYEFEESRLKEHIEEKHHRLYLEASEEKNHVDDNNESKDVKLAPSCGKCDGCETNWASELNSKLHKNGKHVKFTQHLQLQSVGKAQQDSMDETSFSKGKSFMVDTKNEEGNRIFTSMVSIITIIWRMVKVDKKQAGAELGQAQP